MTLSSEDLAQLQSQKWEEEPEYRQMQVVVRHGSGGGSRLAQQPDGTCVFLNEQGLCKIHAKFGAQAKPTICRVFPLQLVPQEKQAVLTIRRACPSSALDLGQSLSDHLPLMQELVREKQLEAAEVTPPLLKQGDRRDWKVIRQALGTLARLLQDQRYPPVRRLVHALQFASLLEKAKTTKLDDAKLTAVIQALEDVVAEESKPFFEERRRPSWYTGIFFRQMAAEFVRLHPQYRTLPTWSERWRMVPTAFHIARGQGRIPISHPEFPLVNFSDLEEPLGKVEPAVYVPLARLIETSAASFLYALAQRTNWSVIESVRALAVLFPVGLWMLRWAAHGRAPRVADMVNIVVSLDRGQSYHNLSGSLHRWRLNTLGTHGELERLVVWYAR